MAGSDEPVTAGDRTAAPGAGGALGEIAELLGGETVRSRRFLRGLVAGALVGAAIAGGSLRRRRERERAGTGDRVS